MLAQLLQWLPEELAIQVLRCAALDSIAGDRAWVIQLALVSRFVYKLVHPVLYHTMVVTGSNVHKVLALARDRDSTHVFHAVRRLVMDDDNWSWAVYDVDLSRLFAGVTSIDAPLYIIRPLATSPDFHPRSLALRYVRLAIIVDLLPRTTFSSVTHLLGFFPSIIEPDAALTEVRIAHMLEAMPALTHLALEMLNMGGVFDDGSEDIDEQLLELDALERALRATLRHDRIQALAIRVAGAWLPHWPSVVNVAMKLKDSRILAWHDTRFTGPQWVQEAACAAADAREGRNIWTEAQRVWRPSACACACAPPHPSLPIGCFALQPCSHDQVPPRSLSCDVVQEK